MEDNIKIVKLNDDLMVITDYNTGESGIVDIPRQPDWMSDKEWADYQNEWQAELTGPHDKPARIQS